MDLRKEEAILEYRLDLAEEKGKKIGKEEGKIEGKIEVAKAMLANGYGLIGLPQKNSFLSIFLGKIMVLVQVL